MLRATQSALVQIRISGESPFYFLRLHEDGGRDRSEFLTSGGAQLEVTTHEGFTCVHLKEECAAVVTCPKKNCLHFSQLDYVSQIVDARSVVATGTDQHGTDCLPPIVSRKLM